jgi:trimeric autotransporter adhesin
MFFKTIHIAALLGAVAAGAFPAGPPAIASISITPNALTGGESASGVVNLMSPAPTGGATLTLSSNNPAVVPGGSSLQIPQGQLAATFPVSTSPVPTNVNATITATLGAASASTTLTVNAPCISGFTVQLSITNGVTGTGTLSGTIALNGPAPSGGTTVNLISGGGNIGTIVVPQGKSGDAVNLNLTDVTQIQETTVTAQTGSCAAVSAPVKKDL